METALILVAGSALLLTILSSLFVVEDRRGGRVVLVSVRTYFDRLCLYLFSFGRRILLAIWRGFLGLVLEHGYRLVVKLVDYLKGIEQRVEHAVLRNYHAAHKERRSRTHLDEIADHKESTALSEEDKKRLKEE